MSRATLTTRRVRRARRIIARDRCPATGVRHRWTGALGYQCIRCKAVR